MDLSNTDCTLQWHEIPHGWNSRARRFIEAEHVHSWSHMVCKQYWMACHAANLPTHRWVQVIDLGTLVVLNVCGSATNVGQRNILH